MASEGQFHVLLFKPHGILGRHIQSSEPWGGEVPFFQITQLLGDKQGHVSQILAAFHDTLLLLTSRELPSLTHCLSGLRPKAHMFFMLHSCHIPHTTIAYDVFNF